MYKTLFMTLELPNLDIENRNLHIINKDNYKQLDKVILEVYVNDDLYEEQSDEIGVTTLLFSYSNDINRSKSEIMCERKSVYLLFNHVLYTNYEENSPFTSIYVSDLKAVKVLELNTEMDLEVYTKLNKSNTLTLFDLMTNLKEYTVKIPYSDNNIELTANKYSCIFNLNQNCKFSKYLRFEYVLMTPNREVITRF